MAETPETTEVPAQETPLTLDDLKEPAHVPHPDNQRELKDGLKKEIDAIDAKIEEVSKQIRKAQQASSGQGDELAAARAEIQRIKKDLDVLVKQRQEIYAARDQVQENQEKQMTEMAKIKSQTKYKTVTEIDRAIAKLEKEQTTTSMPLAKEKELIKEIEELKQAKKKLKQHETAFQSGQAVSPADFKAQLGNVNGQITELKKQMDSNKALLNKMLDKRKDAPVNALHKKRDELRKQKKEKFDELRKLRDAFTAKLTAWKKNQDEWKAYKTQRDKLYKKQQEERREAERLAREEELLKKTPYEEEMQLCDYLTTYLSSTFGSSQAAKSQEDKPKKEKVDQSQYGVELDNKKNQNDPYLVLGNKKKKGSKKGKAGAKNTKRGRIVLVPETIDAFALLKLEAPTTAEQVEASLKELSEKKAYFSTLPRGEIESIAEKNQKFETRPSNNNANKTQKKSNKKNVPKTGDLEDFPALGGAPAAEEETA